MGLDNVPSYIPCREIIENPERVIEKEGYTLYSRGPVVIYLSKDNGKVNCQKSVCPFVHMNKFFSFVGPRCGIRGKDVHDVLSMPVVDLYEEYDADALGEVKKLIEDIFRVVKEDGENIPVKVAWAVGHILSETRENFFKAGRPVVILCEVLRRHTMEVLNNYVEALMEGKVPPDNVYDSLSAELESKEFKDGVVNKFSETTGLSMEFGRLLYSIVVEWDYYHNYIYRERVENEGHRELVREVLGIEIEELIEVAFPLSMLCNLYTYLSLLLDVFNFKGTLQPLY